MLFDAFVVETAVWVFATVVITLCITRVYFNSFFSIAFGRAERAATFKRKWRGRPPFVTVMLPMYNEEKVIDRLLGAATKLDYPHYEILVADDSTDPKAIGRLERWNKDPRVSIIHRGSRKGFKMRTTFLSPT